MDVRAPQRCAWGGYTGHLTDPDGFLWEIATNPGAIGDYVLPDATEVARDPHIGLALMRAAQEAGGIDHLPVPERKDIARTADFE